MPGARLRPTLEHGSRRIAVRLFWPRGRQIALKHLFAAAFLTFLPLPAPVAAQPLDPDSRIVSSETVAGVRVEFDRRERRRAVGSDAAQGPRLQLRIFARILARQWRSRDRLDVSAREMPKRRCGRDPADRGRDGAGYFRVPASATICENARFAPARERALRRSLDAAWPAFSALAGKALAATIAENEAIDDYGKQE